MTRPSSFSTRLALAVVLAGLLTACRPTGDPGAEPASGKAVSPAADAPTDPPVPEYLEVAVPAGTVVKVELDTALASNTSSVEDRVLGRAREPVIVGSRIVIPAGSGIVGTVTSARRSGKVKGRARLAFRFSQIHVDGTTYDVKTRLVSYEAKGTAKQDAVKIGAGAAAGAVIGAIAGGGKGAAVGSAVGGGAGTAVVLMTPGKEVSLPSGTPVSVNVQEEFVVRVKQ